MEGKIFEGEVACILPGGEGVVHREKFDVLIPNVVAGDIVQYRISQKRRGVWRGNILRLITPSPERIPTPCSSADTCGGCALQALSTHAQATLKFSWVKQAFSAFIQPHTALIPIEPQQEAFAGRRRVRWFIEGNTLGFHQRSTHNIVTSQQCIALTSSLDALRKQLEAQLASLPPQVSSIQAVELSNGMHLIAESEQKMPDSFSAPHFQTTTNIQWWWKQKNTPSLKAVHKPVQILHDCISLQPYAAHDIHIQIGANDFIQGHQQGNQQLITQILGWSQGSKRVVDLFSGCGNLSLPIAAAFDATVVGAELNPNSVHAANKNAQHLKCNASYQTIDLFGKFKQEDFVGADTLILDPPRKGAKNICHMMPRLLPKQIIMINCDPAAGARDAKILQQHGYQLQSLRPLDLFPLTGHVEALSLWKPSQ